MYWEERDVGEKNRIFQDSECDCCKKNMSDKLQHLDFNTKEF